MRQLDPSSSQAVYVQVADAIREAIGDREFEPGDLLPGRDALAEHFRVAPMTVSNALRLLREEGVLASRQGQGTSVLRYPKAKRDLAAEIDDLRRRVETLERR